MGTINTNNQKTFVDFERITFTFTTSNTLTLESRERITQVEWKGTRSHEKWSKHKFQAKLYWPATIVSVCLPSKSKTFSNRFYQEVWCLLVNFNCIHIFLNPEETFIPLGLPNKILSDNMAFENREVEVTPLNSELETQRASQ